MQICSAQSHREKNRFERGFAVRLFSSDLPLALLRLLP
jgi:hypothetical protein